jgi:formate-nitrite transporter family protein
MSSDLQGGKDDEREPKKASGQILQHEIEEGRVAIQRPVGGLFVSGVSAGLDIGFSLFLMGVMKTQVEGTLSRPIAAMLVANMYAIGFIFVVLGRSAAAIQSRHWPSALSVWFGRNRALYCSEGQPAA